MFKRHIPVFLLIIFVSLHNVAGQKLVNSPYSRFNIGTLEPVASFKSQSMGGVSTALRDITSIFHTNPASYSAIDTTSFIFDFGFDYSMNFISKGGESYFSDDMNFDHLLMGLPIIKGWGVAFGVVPVSNGYYRIYDTVLKNDPDYDPVTGAYTSQHSGEGGYNNFILGTGFQLFKHFSFGVNMTVLFGNLERKYDVTFGDFYNTFHNNSLENIQLGGVNFDYGFQYSTLIGKNYFFNAGVSMTSGHNYNSKYQRFSYKSTGFGDIDTISYAGDDNGTAYIPGTIRAGIALGKVNKFTAAFDYVSSAWSELSMPEINGYAADTKYFHFGIEYIPEKYSNFSFFRRAEYRAGAHYGDNYLIVDGDQVKEYGASLGIGIPMGLSLTDKRSLSRTNVMFDWTRRYGSSSGKLHEENFFTFGISLNFYDFWFVKRKYD